MDGLMIYQIILIKFPAWANILEVA
jgi:hypothetical protein